MSSLDSSPSSSFASFLKLDDSNFSIWKDRMTDALKMRKLWRYANGTEGKPVKEAVTDTRTPASVEKEYAKAMREWEENDDAASALIRSYVTDGQLHHVKDCNSSHDTWTKICAAHEKQSMHHALQWVGQINNAHFPEGGKVQEHITSLRTANERLAATDMGMSYSDALLAGILMHSMPSSYDPIKMTLSTFDKTKFTFSAVSQALLAEEARRTTDSSYASLRAEQSAFLVNRQQLQRSDNPKKTCNWCGLDGHLDSDCYRKQDGKPQSSAEEKQAARRLSAQRRAERRNRKGDTEDKTQTDRNAFHVLVCEDDEPLAAVADSTQPPLVEVPPDSALTTHTTPPHAVSLHSRGAKAVGGLDWYVDSGASYHYCRNRDWFDTFEPLTGQTVALGDGRRVPLAGKGTLSVSVPTSRTASAATTIHNVQYVPDLSANLLSVSALTALGLSVTFDGRHCTIRRQKAVLGQATRVSNKLYQLTVTRLPLPGGNTQEPRALTASASQQSTDSLQLWHRRLGHVHHDAVRTQFSQHMAKDAGTLSAARPFSPSASDAPLHCDACSVGKAHRLPFPKASTTRSTAPLQLVHTDICGPFRVPSIGKARYFIVIVDDFSRFIWLRTMVAKSEAEQYFKEYQRWAENLHDGHRIQQVRFDGGGEFGSKAFRAYLSSKGITVQQTASYTPQQNGVAERANRTLIECMRTMMCDWTPAMPVVFWAEALRTAAYIRNRCTTRALKGMTPYEAWYGVKPSYGHLHAYGCLAYAHIPKEVRLKPANMAGKLGPKAHRCALIGYSEDQKAYRLWDTDTNKLLLSRDVEFVESLPGMTAHFIASHAQLQGGGPNWSQPSQRCSHSRTSLCQRKRKINLMKEKMIFHHSYLHPLI